MCIEIINSPAVIGAIIGAIVGAVASTTFAIVTSWYKFNKRKKGAKALIKSELDYIINALKKFREIYVKEEIIIDDNKMNHEVFNFYNIMVEDEFVTSNQPKVTYRINPKNADLTNVEWSFINRTVTTKVAGDAADLISIVGEPVVENGGATFTVKANKALETVSPKETIVALQAVSEGKTDDIVSDYSFVEQEDLDQFQIIDKVKYEAEESAVDPFGTPIDDSETVDVNTLTADLNLVYDKELVVSDYLETYAAISRPMLRRQLQLCAR